MKKLKKFVLKPSQRLSNEEMASIEGMDIIAVDVCTERGQTCVLEVNGGVEHSTVTLGTCVAHTSTNGSVANVYYTCE